MKLSGQTWPAWMLALLFSSLLTRRLMAQDGTHWLNLRPITAFTEMDVEWEKDTETVGSMKINSDRLYLAPTLGLGLSGSIYHPNLLQFDIKGQGGYIEQDLSSQYGSARQSSTQDSYLQNYDVNLSLLRNQPYAANFTATKTHTIQELDAFNQVMVDSQSYGCQLGYKAGPIPFSLSLKHLDETETGLAYNNAFAQDSLDFNAANERARGSTTFSYELGQYTQTTTDIAQKQTYQYGTLQDVEKFWKDDRGRLTSMVYFNQEDESGNEADNVTVQENLALWHSPSWNSFYNYNYNDSYVDPADTTTHLATIGLRNQLYESLSSAMDVHGTLENESAPGNSAAETTYGIGNSETYSKRLGNWGHLTLGNTARFDWTHDNNSGAVNTVFNEQHALTDGTPTFLTQPRVLAVTKVTDPTGVHVYLNGIDYALVRAGSGMQIERVPTSLNLTNNSSVLVNYTVQAEPSGSYTTFSDQVQLRLDLFNGLADVYSGLGWVENQAPADFVLENSFSTLSGFDFNWRWLRAGGTYETQNASLISYITRGLYQTATFRPDNSSTFSINAREQWMEYFQPQQSIADYTFTARYSERFNRHLDGTVEAGVLNQAGGPQAETLFTAGAHIKYFVGKLSFSLAYQFNQQNTLNGAAERNLFSFTARRDF